MSSKFKIGSIVYTGLSMNNKGMYQVSRDLHNMYEGRILIADMMGSVVDTFDTFEALEESKKYTLRTESTILY
jgi:hypothetical protein